MPSRPTTALGTLVSLAAGFGVVACGSDPAPGPTDAAPSVDAGSPDASGADASADAEVGDAGAVRDASVCDPLATTSSRAWARPNGRIEVNDYDYFDETFFERARVRNAGFNFRTRALPIRPSVDAPLFSSLPADACVALDVPAFVDTSGPPRDVGARILIRDRAGVPFVELIRTLELDGPRYDFATGEDARRFFDRDELDLGVAWSYELPGGTTDSSPVTATVPGVPDFEVTPAFTSTRAPALLLSTGATIRWAPTASSAMSIVLERATDPDGGGRYLVCRVVDDGEHTFGAEQLAAFGADPGVPFGLAVARSAFVPICRGGLVGVVSHVLAYVGLAEVR
ncbi:MAG: hypothetical protein HYV07_34065 [Deltaproteobacteria bacterium]|nr:hypothetical protein [Deltaproteobacteria bacterium]